MRDFLEDAEEHRDAGRGRAQKSTRQEELPKRFYKDVGVGAVDGGFAVTLDGRPTRTPGRLLVAVPSEDLAWLMAEEWAAQGERIDPLTMPLVRLINAAIESGDAKRDELQAEIVRYASGDLLLYRADSPEELVAEEEAVWDDALVRLARHFGIGFQPTIGILHQAQPEPTLNAMRRAVADEPLVPLTALVSVTSLAGSGLLAIALRYGLLTPDEVWRAAHVDEDYNIRLWGEVEEATERRQRRRREFDAAVVVLRLLPRGA
jgi:chaperone required for assembly of F1-ATPase